MIDEMIEKEVPLFVLNPQASRSQLEEGLYEFLVQLGALTELCFYNGTSEYPPSFMHNYLCIINQHAIYAKEIFSAISSKQKNYNEGNNTA